MNLPDSLTGLVAADAAGIADLIVRLHNDEALNQAYGAAGLAFVTEALSETRLDALMREAVGLRAA